MVRRSLYIEDSVYSLSRRDLKGWGELWAPVEKGPSVFALEPIEDVSPRVHDLRGLLILGSTIESHAHALSLTENLRWLLIARPEMKPIRFRAWGVEPEIVGKGEQLNPKVAAAVPRLAHEIIGELGQEYWRAGGGLCVLGDLCERMPSCLWAGGSFGTCPLRNHKIIVFLPRFVELASKDSREDGKI